MGYLKHHAIVVTSWNKNHLYFAFHKACEIFSSKNISNVVGPLINGQSSFMIAPDGSKEGWEESDIGDVLRKRFMDWAGNIGQEESPFFDAVEVCFGGDEASDNTKIVRFNEQ